MFELILGVILLALLIPAVLLFVIILLGILLPIFILALIVYIVVAFGCWVTGKELPFKEEDYGTHQDSKRE